MCRLHARPEAKDRVEHRDRRRRRLLPVLVGWAAVTGTVAWPAVVLFGVIFFWTPPHFWALAMKFRDDYAPPACRCSPWSPPAVVARKILIYSGIMVVASLALVPSRAGSTGRRGGARRPVPVEAGRLRGGSARRGPAPMRLFHLSIGYLTLLFAAMAVTALLPFGRF